MDPTLCVLPSNAPSLRHGTERPEVEPENPGLSSLDSCQTVIRSSSHALQRTSLPTVNTRSQTTGGVLQVSERRRRKPNRAKPSRDPLFTKAELQSDRYRAYREKNKRGGKKGQEDQVWTDELEEIFQLALRQIPNIGRKKTPCDVLKCGTNETKQSGRNEHISHFIKRCSGEPRNRKQVSSHIQVLKKFQKGNHEWLSLVTQASPTQHVTVSSNAPFQEYSIRRIKFEMYILDREGQRKLHAYSSLQSEIGSASRALEEAKDWRIKYPRLAPYYDRGELDVEIILFETYFSLMEEQPPYKSKLRIDFEIDVARGVEFTQWECHAYFYENDILEESVSTPTNLERLPGTSDARIIVGLHSSWWVDHFVALANQRMREREGDRRAIKSEEERPVCQIRDISVVQEIWATPQTGGRSKRMALFLWNFRESRTQEAATTTWRKLTPPCLLTEPYFSPQTLTSQQVQPSLATDTTFHHQDQLQPTPLYAEYFNPQPSFFVENLGHVDSQIADPDVRLKCTSSTPIGSSSSSTSTSMPSSTPNSTLPLEVSQDSAYSSQDGHFQSQNATCTSRDLTYDSQYSSYPFPEFEYPSETSPVQSQDTTYNAHVSGTESQLQDHPSKDYYRSQDTVYQSQHIDHLGHRFPPDQFLQHQPTENSPNHCDNDTSSTVQNFANMHLQLSFCESDDSVLAYDAPCVAPTVNMLGPQAHFDGREQFRQKSSLCHLPRSQIQDPFDFDQWQTMDQAVQWASSRLQNGDFEEVGDIMGQGQVLGEIEELERGIDVEMGLMESYGHGMNDNLPT